MSANVIENKFAVRPVVKPINTPSRKAVWSGTMFVSFIGSGFCFLTGLLLSAATSLSVLTASRFAAYANVAILFSAFLLAFVGAHAMDRIDDERRRQERAQFNERNGAVVSIQAAKAKFSKK